MAAGLAAQFNGNMQVFVVIVVLQGAVWAMAATASRALLAGSKRTLRYCGTRASANAHRFTVVTAKPSLIASARCDSPSAFNSARNSSLVRAKMASRCYRSEEYMLHAYFRMRSAF